MAWNKWESTASFITRALQLFSNWPVVVANMQPMLNRAGVLNVANNQW
jgi:hypothetical protein